MKRLLLIFHLIMTIGITFSLAQVTTIGLIGSSTPGGWDNDTDMVQDATNPDLWSLTIALTTGEAKFRANDAWDLNWGSKAFPVGTGTQNGDNIPVYAGNYTITFNAVSGEYNFDVDSDIGIIGSATPGGWDNDTDMYIDPADPNKYYTKLNLIVGEAKFRQADGWTVNWGANTFPTGVGTQDGPNIPIATAAEYTINFDKSTGAYSFELPPAFLSIGAVGSATPGGWDNDTDMLQDPVNPNVWRGDLTLTTGEIKFRADNAWTLSWGGTDFPTGKATVGGGNIPVAEAGRYVFWFNTSTLDYSFIKADITAIGIIGSATPGGWDNDTDMIQDTANANIWTININLANGEAKFRANDAWAINWGATAFPKGKGTQDGPNVPVLFGNYDVTFNSLTGEYEFKVNSDIGIIGSATPGGWDNDTDLYQDAADSNKYFNTLDLIGGEAKFRKDNGWTINWGAVDFPAGIGTQDGPNIPIAQGGKYYITFDKSTAAYTFTEIVPFTSIGVIGTATAGGWDTDTDLTRDAVNGDLWTGRIDLLVGELKFRADNDWVYNWGGVDFPIGIGVKDGDNLQIPEAGKYQITFNSKTLEYTFAIIRPYTAIGIIGSATPGGWDVDTDMEQDATDPLIWKLRIKLLDGELKFRADNDWIVNWGSGDFPSGIGEQDGANIPIVAGDYKITFNTLSGVYNFEAVVEFGKISLVGSCGPFLAWPGADDSFDTYLEKDANDPNHWTHSSVTLAQYDGTETANGIKFRAEAAWAVNWGAADFPAGVGTQDGPNIQCNAGTYKVDLRTDTGEYAFGDPNSTIDYLSDAVISVFPNPTASFINIDVKESVLKGKTQITLFDALGRVAYNGVHNTTEVVRINASTLNNGKYIIRISNDKFFVSKNINVVR